MKKIILLFTAVIGLASLQSCEVNDIRENQIFEAEVFEFPASLDNDFSKTGYFSRDILTSDHILIYRLYGQDGGTDVWRLLPQTVFLNNVDRFNYNYDFTKRDFRIFIEGETFNLNQLTNQERNEYVLNQIFRIVVVPGRLQYKMDFSDYDATIRSLGLENAPIKKL